MQLEKNFSAVLAPGQVRVNDNRSRSMSVGKKRTQTPTGLASRRMCSQEDVMRPVEAPFVLCLLPGFIDASDGGNIVRKLQQLFLKRHDVLCLTFDSHKLAPVSEVTLISQYECHG